VPGRTALQINDMAERLSRAGKDLDMTGISFHPPTQEAIVARPPQ